MTSLLAASTFGFVVIVVVVIAAILVLGGVFGGIGRITRREERGGNVKAPDDPTQRPPRA